MAFELPFYSSFRRAREAKAQGQAPAYVQQGRQAFERLGDTSIPPVVQRAREEEARRQQVVVQTASAPATDLNPQASLREGMIAGRTLTPSPVFNAAQAAALTQEQKALMRQQQDFQALQAQRRQFVPEASASTQVVVEGGEALPETGGNALGSAASFVFPGYRDVQNANLSPVDKLMALQAAREGRLKVETINKGTEFEQKKFTIRPKEATETQPMQQPELLGFRGNDPVQAVQDVLTGKPAQAAQERAFEAQQRGDLLGFAGFSAGAGVASIPASVAALPGNFEAARQRQVAAAQRGDVLGSLAYSNPAILGIETLFPPEQIKETAQFAVQNPQNAAFVLLSLGAGAAVGGAVGKGVSAVGKRVAPTVARVATRVAPPVFEGDSFSKIVQVEKNILTPVGKVDLYKVSSGSLLEGRGRFGRGITVTSEKESFVAIPKAQGSDVPVISRGTATSTRRVNGRLTETTVPTQSATLLEAEQPFRVILQREPRQILLQPKSILEIENPSRIFRSDTMLAGERVTSRGTVAPQEVDLLNRRFRPNQPIARPVPETVEAVSRIRGRTTGQQGTSIFDIIGIQFAENAALGRGKPFNVEVFLPGRRSAGVQRLVLDSSVESIAKTEQLPKTITQRINQDAASSASNLGLKTAQERIVLGVERFTGRTTSLTSPVFSVLDKRVRLLGDQSKQRFVDFSLTGRESGVGVVSLLRDRSQSLMGTETAQRTEFNLIGRTQTQSLTREDSSTRSRSITGTETSTESLTQSQTLTRTPFTPFRGFGIPFIGGSTGSISGEPSPRNQAAAVFRVQGFLGYVKAKPSAKSKYVKVTPRAVPRVEALNRVYDVADNTTSRSVKIVPTKQMVPDRNVQDNGLGLKFQPQKKNKNILIERNTYAIDTPGEKRQLNVARYLAEQRKAFTQPSRSRSNVDLLGKPRGGKRGKFSF